MLMFLSHWYYVRIGGNVVMSPWCFIIIMYSFMFIKWQEINMTVPSALFNMFLCVPVNEFVIGLR